MTTKTRPEASGEKRCGRGRALRRGAGQPWWPTASTHGIVRDIEHALMHAVDVDAMFQAVADGAARLGFEQCAYGIRLPTSFTRPKTLIVSSYDEIWKRRYEEANYVCTDPTVAHGMRTTAPLIWSDKVFSAAPQLWSEAREYGLRVGWARSCMDGQGGVGMLSLARSHEALSRAELTLRSPQLCWLAYLAHEWLGRALGAGCRPQRPELSLREVEVLQWTADGKSMDEVARLLRISKHTVGFHVRNIIAKFGVVNKTAAVVRATALRMLS